MGVQLSVGKGRKKQPEPDINVTPLVDVVLVLLIIFMVVTPALQEGEAVTLPEINKPDDKPKDDDPFEVTIALHDRAVVNDERIPYADLVGRLKPLHEQAPNRKVMLKVDQNVEYARVRETFFNLQDMGFKGVALKVNETKKEE